MTEFKSQLNMRLTPDANVSFTATAIIDNEEQAEEFGAHVMSLVSAWCRGYEQQAKDEAA